MNAHKTAIQNQTGKRERSGGRRGRTGMGRSSLANRYRRLAGSAARCDGGPVRGAEMLAARRYPRFSRFFRDLHWNSDDC